MSLLYGYTNKSNEPNISSAINTYDALQLAYKKLAISCNKNGDAAAEAMIKANSASYRARKADEAVKSCSNIKTFTREIEITHYGNPKTLKTFKKGIVLLGIVTKANPNNDESKFGINYDFYDITGNKHIAVIQGRQKYKILKDSDDVSNIQDVHTSLRPCSISINLMGKDTKSNKPNKPIKLEVIIQYIELSGGVSEIEHNGMFGK